jgi:hypothetical protein
MVPVCRTHAARSVDTQLRVTDPITDNEQNSFMHTGDGAAVDDYGEGT